MGDSPAAERAEDEASGAAPEVEEAGEGGATEDVRKAGEEGVEEPVEEPLTAAEEKQARRGEDERVKRKQEEFEQYLASAKDMWEEFTTGNKFKKKKEELERERVEKEAICRKLGIMQRDLPPSFNRGSTMGCATGKGNANVNLNAQKPP